MNNYYAGSLSAAVLTGGLIGLYALLLYRGLDTDNENEQPRHHPRRRRQRERKMNKSMHERGGDRGGEHEQFKNAVDNEEWETSKDDDEDDVDQGCRHGLGGVGDGH